MEFQYITNPTTGRKVNVNGRIGRQVVRNYMQIAGAENGIITPSVQQICNFMNNITQKRCDAKAGLTYKDDITGRKIKITIGMPGNDCLPCNTRPDLRKYGVRKFSTFNGYLANGKKNLVIVFNNKSEKGSSLFVKGEGQKDFKLGSILEVIEEN